MRGWGGAQVQMSLSQRPSLTAGGEGVTLLHELLGFLRRSLSQQAPVRRAVYQVLAHFVMVASVHGFAIRVYAWSFFSTNSSLALKCVCSFISVKQYMLLDTVPHQVCCHATTIYTSCWAVLAPIFPKPLHLSLQGLPALLAEDPVAQGPVLEMLLLPRFRPLLAPDPALHPPIRLARCAALAQVQASFPRVSPSTVLQALLQMTPLPRCLHFLARSPSRCVGSRSSAWMQPSHRLAIRVCGGPLTLTRVFQALSLCAGRGGGADCGAAAGPDSVREGRRGAHAEGRECSR